MIPDRRRFIAICGRSDGSGLPALMYKIQITLIPQGCA